jgi:hypothetical protein
LQFLFVAAIDVPTALQDLAPQTLALDQFHAEVMPAVPLAYLINRNDVWMAQIGASLRFGPKSPHLIFTGQLPGQNHFQGDEAV